MKNKKGFTLTEVILSLLIMTVVIGVPINMFINSNRSFNKITSINELQYLSTKFFYSFQKDIDENFFKIESIHNFYDNKIFDAMFFKIDKDNNNIADKTDENNDYLIGYALLKEDINNDNIQDVVIKKINDKKVKIKLYQLVRIEINKPKYKSDLNYWKKNGKIVCKHITVNKIDINEQKYIFDIFSFLGNDIKLDSNRDSIISEKEIGNFYTENGYIDYYNENRNAFLAEIDKVKFINISLKLKYQQGTELYEYNLSKLFLLK